MSAQAFLARERSIDLRILSTGALSLVREQMAELSPCRIGYALVQASLATGSIRKELARLDILAGVRTRQHAFDVQSLDLDRAERLNDPAAHLMQEVVPSITDFLVHTSDHSICSLASRCAFPGGGLLAVGFRQRFLCLPKEARIGDERAVGQSRKMMDPYVDSNRPIARGKRLSLDFTGEAGPPFARLSADRTGLDRPSEGTMDHRLDLTDLGEADEVLADREACAWIGEGVIVPLALETGIAGLLAGRDASEEGLVGFLDAPDDLLQHLREDGIEFRMLLFPVRKSVDLVDVGGRTSEAFIVVFAPVDAGVIDLAAESEGIIQHPSLF